MPTSVPGEQRRRWAEELSGEVLGIVVRTDCRAQAGLEHEIYDSLVEVVKELAADEPLTPQAVLRIGLSGMSRAEEKQFLVQNLLESVKRGNKLTDTINKYRELGLTDVDTEADSPAYNPSAERAKNGAFLNRLGRQIKRFAVRLLKIIVEALRLLGLEKAGIKPSLGLAAGMPSFSLEIDIEAVTIQEFLDILVDTR
jgi:hypothetical protein